MRSRAATRGPALTPAVFPPSRTQGLAGLILLWPDELADATPAGRARIIARLEQALRAERRRGIAGHRAYDLARHVALLKAYRAEVAAAGGRYFSRRVPRPIFLARSERARA